jgi:uncharacterized protein YndB with AHSA1/START domain
VVVSVPESEDVQQSWRSRAAAWIKELFQKEREEQFAREEQLTMVWMGHALIAGGVWLILELLFGDEPKGHSLRYFWILEAAIIVPSFVIANTSSKWIVNALKKGVMSLDPLEKWMDRHGDAVRVRLQAGTLLVVYALQLGSMVALLIATGGPIDSPFAPMALAIAVFTPFIVNKWWTVGLIIISTMVFYSVFVAIAGFDEDKTHPKPFAYAAVNLFILLLASLMTLKRRDAPSFTVRRTFNAPREKVWKAWTDRGQVVQWFASGRSNGSHVEMDVRPEGEWKAVMLRQDGTPGFPWSGAYREVDPPKRLVFTIAGRAGRGEEVVEVELEERDGKTLMTVKLSDDGRYQGLKEGWSSFFDRMDQFLDERS